MSSRPSPWQRRQRMVGVVVGIGGLCRSGVSVVVRLFPLTPGGLGAVWWSAVSVAPLWFAVVAMSPR